MIASCSSRSRAWASSAPALQFRFATATTGASALELLRHTAFDVAIVAVYLPVVDGPT